MSCLHTVRTTIFDWQRASDRDYRKYFFRFLVFVDSSELLPILKVLFHLRMLYTCLLKLNTNHVQPIVLVLVSIFK